MGSALAVALAGKWVGFALAAVLVNGFALLVSSVPYTAWSIRSRNRGYYLLFRREINRRRAEDAEEIAENVVKWLRPLCLILVNSLLVYVAILNVRML